MQITSLPGPFYKLYRYAEPQLRRETQAKNTAKWSTDGKKLSAKDYPIRRLQDYAAFPEPHIFDIKPVSRRY